jgi:hypothetical protein
MGTVPRIGSGRTLSSAAEELTQAPVPELLGTISPDALKHITSEPPPPWESDPRYHRHNTDARRFVAAPDNWELRWLNPRAVETIGFRDWEAVSASDPRVKVLNRAMIAPDNTIRKGGHGGDFLAWMWKSWVESRNRLKSEKVARLTGEARTRQERTREEINRGSYGKYVKVDSVTHPTHTQGDGRSMTD